jgi:YidC/Oxa1 family membrane protein insertase
VENSNNTIRFIIAAVLSLLVLLGWTYFYAPTKPASNTNTAANTNAEQPVTQPTAAPQAPAPTQQTATATPDTTPGRSITIKSPLYEAKLDTKGAVATSWILFRNVSPMGDVPIYADGSTDTNKIPLQLISEKALQQTPRDVPFRVVTADANLNSVANERNYQTSAEDVITLGPGDERKIEFTLAGENGVEVKKTFVFRGDSYVSDLAIDLKQNGQPVPNTQLAIGASIGDHAISHHNFYHIESEAVAAINGDIKRHQGASSFKYNADNTATLADSGTVDWAGVGDAYFRNGGDTGNAGSGR